jgi:membrane-anchored glycerophosphoryl diester phosphodiesterase (GDPDase)
MKNAFIENLVNYSHFPIPIIAIGIRTACTGDVTISKTTDGGMKTTFHMYLLKFGLPIIFFIPMRSSFGKYA